MSSLTDAQRRMVEENLGLVGWMLGKLSTGIRASNLPWDDAEQAGRYGLCKAARSWNPDKGAFSTYAAFAIRNEMIAACDTTSVTSFGRDTMRKRPELRVHPLSLDVMLCEGVCLIDMLADPAAHERLEDYVISKDIIRIFEDRERFILVRVAAGRSMAETARELGVTRQAIDQTIKRARRKMIGYLARAAL